MTDRIEYETLTTHRVTARGMRQIRAWVEQWLHPRTRASMSQYDLHDMVLAYAADAESTDDGLIEMRPWETWDGCPATLQPERETRTVLEPL